MKLQIQYKNILEVLTVVSFLPTLIYEKSGKSSFSFNQEFIKTLIILKVSKDVCGKLCTHWFYPVKSHLLQLCGQNSLILDFASIFHTNIFH